MSTLGVKTTCMRCGRDTLVFVDETGFYKWSRGPDLIQDALPELSAGEREALVSGTCAKCWDEMFSED